jgi:hypothetical protein
MGSFSDDQAKTIHLNVKEMKKGYYARANVNMIANYRCSLKKEMFFIIIQFVLAF